MAYSHRDDAKKAFQLHIGQISKTTSILMHALTTRAPEVFIYSCGNAAHRLWKPSVTHKKPYSKHQPLLCQQFSPVLTFLFCVPAIPFSRLPFHPRVAHQTSPAWVCADRKPTDRLPGHSERSWASLHEAPRRDSVTANPLGRLGGTICSLHGAEKQQRRVCICIMLSLIDQQKWNVNWTLRNIAYSRTLVCLCHSVFASRSVYCASLFMFPCPFSFDQFLLESGHLFYM